MSVLVMLGVSAADSAMWIRKNGLKVILAGSAVIGGVVLSLFNNWEIGGETWGYWFFSRVLAEGGGFVNLDRAPLYTLYLNAFRWLGYPASVTVEYLTTSFILVAAIVALFRRYLGLGLAVLAALLWLPFLQTAEPSVQTLALACSCWAIVVRRMEGSRLSWAASYALFGLAWMFRGTYLIFIVVFAVWDLLRSLRLSGLRTFFLWRRRPRLSHWPIALVVGLLVCFAVCQSPHQWNNASFASTAWFPYKGKSLAVASFIQSYNWNYIEAEYGTFEGRDFYFTNRELFGGANNAMGAIAANPQFVMGQIYRNAKSLISTMASVTDLRRSWSGSPHSGWITVIMLMAMLYGAFRASRARSDEWMSLFIIGNILAVGATVAFMPKGRYMVPLVPVLILSASWYVTWVRSVITTVRLWSTKRVVCFGLVGCGLISLWLMLAAVPKLFTILVLVVIIAAAVLVVAGRYGPQQRAQQSLSILASLSAMLVLILFSNGASRWGVLTRDIIVNDIRQGEVQVLERSNDSMKASFKTLESVVQDCRGVMSLESTFIGAFLNVPPDRVYDIWEIPPFGYLGDQAYNGLHPDRIDCVLVSDELATGVGYATNHQIRYQNYIKPYVEQLKEMGATVYEIPRFGSAIILRNPGD